MIEFHRENFRGGIGLLGHVFLLFLKVGVLKITGEARFALSTFLQRDGPCRNATAQDFPVYKLPIVLVTGIFRKIHRVYRIGIRFHYFDTANVEPYQRLCVSPQLMNGDAKRPLLHIPEHMFLAQPRH